MPTIYVFEDGETWSAAPPTAVVLTDEQLQRLIENGGKVQAVIDEDEGEGEKNPCETCDKMCGEGEGEALLFGSFSAWLCLDCYAKEAPEVLKNEEEDAKSANSSTYGEGCRRICRMCGEECSCWNYNDEHEVVCEDCEEGEDEDEEDESCVIPKCCDNAEGCDECVSVKSDCECDNECAEKHTCTECHKKGCFCDGIEKCDRCDWAACKECDSEGKQIDEEWVCGSCLLEEEK